MLSELSVSQVVLIRELSIELAPGFNVLTGETGAGKSVLVEALGLVLGGRARPEIVRRGAKEAEVSALFIVAPGSRVEARLREAGIPCEGELAVRRIVHAEGRSRAFMNGRLCTAGQLAELAPDLCDISSQHESVSLTDQATHLDYLDSFGGLADRRQELAGVVDLVLRLTSEIEALRNAERGRVEREEFLSFQLREIDDLGPAAGEEDTLQAERARLRHAEQLREATARAAERLGEGDRPICDELARVAGDLSRAADVDASLASLARSVESARLELSEVARALGRYAEGIESRPDRLEAVEDRLFRLNKLLSRHGPTTRELLEHRAALAAELTSLSTGEARVAALEAERAAKLEEAGRAARALSDKRRAAAEELGQAISRELRRLAMGRAKVVVDVAEAPPAEGGLAWRGARLSRSGIDRVEFLIAPNAGEEPRPLRKIASGGELSRSLLALKRVLAGSGPAGLYVFDEVDAGVGGAVAEVIGRAIADVARHRQVLCITHLPQIAALADAHFVIEKSEAKGRTLAELRRIEDGSARIDEIARMLGGVNVGQAARRAAQELLAAKETAPAG